MDFPSQAPESPARPLAGAARSRVLARQQRSSAKKPYNRSELPTSGSSGSLYPQGDGSSSSGPGTPVSKNLESTIRGPFTPLRAAISPFAMLGSVTKMVSKPLSWLTRSVAATQPELGIPTSSSTGSLSSLARKRAAAQMVRTHNDIDDNPSALAARAVGERLAAGLRSRTAPPKDDEENQLRPSKMSSVTTPASTSRFGPAKLSSVNETPLAGSSSLARSFTFSEKLGAGKPMTWSNRASKRVLDIASPAHNDTFDTYSDNGRAASPTVNVRSPRSQVLRNRSSSRVPEDAMSDSGSVLSHSKSSYAFGYGNEVRYADSSFGLPPSTSPFQLAARGNVRRARSSLGPALFPDPATPRKSPRSGLTGLRGASPAASVVTSASRARDSTPHRRIWNGLNLAAPSAPSIGDDMMKEYLSTRTSAAAKPAPARSHDTSDMLISSPIRSATAGSVMDESAIFTPGRLGKRDIDMSVDGDSERLVLTGTPSKRRMVWHPDLGFISHEELKAREPKLPSPKNEAERLLNVLETMRATKAKVSSGPSRGPSAMIHVPTPTSETPVSKTSSRGDSKTPIHVAPYSRAIKKAKDAQPASDATGGMRSRLRKVQPPETTINVAEEDGDDADQGSIQQNMEEPEQPAAEELEESEPKPEPVRRSRRLQHRDPDTAPEVTAPSKFTDTPKHDSQLKSALKSTPHKNASVAAPTSIETPKPSSHRISLAVASKVPTSSVKKDNFAVKASSADPNAPREKSSLRQGAAKTSRTHQSSGKFSAWDEDDEDEDLPDANELAKIKIPANMFPSGFSFGAAEPSKQESSKASEPQPSGGSLLGRLGGFDSSSTVASNKMSEKPSLSFTAPTKNAPSAPKFSFGAQSTSIATEKKEEDRPKISGPPASDFFSKPFVPSTSSTAEEKKDGPVPNFFSSTMSKFDSNLPKAEPASSTNGAAFSFGGTSNAGSRPDEASYSSAPSKSSTKSLGGAAFGSDVEKKGATSVSKPSFFGGPASAAPTSGAFSFGAPTASNTDLKRSADDDADSSVKTNAPSFSFGSMTDSKSEAPTATPAASSSGTFSFGATKPTGNASSKAAGDQDLPGAKSDAPAASTGGFSFGKTAEKPTPPAGAGFSFSKPDAAPSSAISSTGFSFSKPAPEASSPSTGGFSFGAPSASAEVKSTSTTPSFSFGANKPASVDAAPASSPSTPGTGATTPTSFTFGVPPSSSSASAAKPAPSSFSFGSSASTGTGGLSGGFGGLGNNSDKPASADKPSFGGGTGEMMDDVPQNSGSSLKFSFGASPSSGTPSRSATPAPSTSFTFGAPSSSAATSSSSAPASSGFGSAPTSTFTFGSGAPASGSMTPSGAPPTGGFSFGSPAPTSAPTLSAVPSFTFGGGASTPGAAANSAPASPFLVSQQAPTTPGGSPFQFGAPTASSSTPFQFGAGAAGAAPSSSAGFSFGAPAASNPAPTFGGFGGGTPPPSAGGGGGNAGFSFGTGLPSMPSMPSMPGTPGAGAAGGNMFSMGTAPAANANSSPGARQIKPLRQRKR